MPSKVRPILENNIQYRVPKKQIPRKDCVSSLRNYYSAHEAAHFRPHLIRLTGECVFSRRRVKPVFPPSKKTPEAVTGPPAPE